MANDQSPFLPLQMDDDDVFPVSFDPESFADILAARLGFDDRGEPLLPEADEDAEPGPDRYADQD